MTSGAGTVSAARLRDAVEGGRWRRCARIRTGPLPARLAEPPRSSGAGAARAALYPAGEGTLERGGDGRRRRGRLTTAGAVPSRRAACATGALWVPPRGRGGGARPARPRRRRGRGGRRARRDPRVRCSDRRSARTVSRAWSRRRTSRSARALLELESLYDLGLSLAGQLDLAGARRRGPLPVHLADGRAARGPSSCSPRTGRRCSRGTSAGSSCPRARSPRWELPEGEAVDQQRGRRRADGGRAADLLREVPGRRDLGPGRRLGVLAVADKESRDGGVLDFTATDARLLSLFANQAAAAIETARLHRAAIEKERIERELELAAAIQREILPALAAGGRGRRARGRRTCRRARSAATTTISSRSRGAARLSRGGRLGQGRAGGAPRFDACTRPCTSRSTRPRPSPSSSRASTATCAASPRRESS